MMNMVLNRIKLNHGVVLGLRQALRARSTTPLLDQEPLKPTIDESEVAKLSKMSAEWWDSNGELRGLHSMNKLRVQLIRDCLLYSKHGTIDSQNLALPLQGIKIMDVGCGGGILTEPLARIGAHVTGLDASLDLIEVARKHAEGQDDIRDKVEYICGSVEDEAGKKPEQFDAVVASEVLEHVVEKDLFLESCAQLIKPGGSLFITTLNKTMLAWVAGVMTAEYVLRLVPRDTHDWEKFVEPTKLVYMLEKYDCSTKLVHGMFYNFICNEWFWTSNMDINYALHAVKKK